MVGKVGNVDYKVKMASGKVKTFHINMLKKHYQRKATDDEKQNKSTHVKHQVAAIACVSEDESDETNSTAVVKDVIWCLCTTLYRKRVSMTLLSIQN